MGEVGGTLQNGQLEARYVRSSDAAQVPMDLAVSAIGVMYATVLARKALEIEGPKTAMVHAILTAAYFLLPLILIWRDRQAYAAIRQRFLMTWLPSLWYFACRAGEVLNHVPSDSSRGLLLMLLLRSQVVMLFWANMSVRLPIRRHMLAHGFALLISLSFNTWRCRWALQAAPQVQEPCRLIVGWLRRVTLASALRKLPPEPVSDCVLLLTYLQLSVGYVLPCLITLRLERNSRRRLLARSQQGWRQQQQQQQHVPVVQGGAQQQQQEQQRWQQGYRVSRLHARLGYGSTTFNSLWLPWQALLVMLACWHLTEGAVRWLPQLLKKD